MCYVGGAVTCRKMNDIYLKILNGIDEEVKLFLKRIHNKNIWNSTHDDETHSRVRAYLRE